MTYKRIEMQDGDDPEAEQFADELRMLLSQYGYDLALITVVRSDGQMIQFENRRHVRRVIVTEGEVH